MENVTDANIIVAVKMTNDKDGYPTYDTVFYHLNQNYEEKCQLSYKNQTHGVCKIVTHRLATRFTLRFRACWRRGICTDYSNWQTVWTLPPRKRTSQFIKVNCILDIVKPGKTQAKWSITFTSRMEVRRTACTSHVIALIQTLKSEHVSQGKFNLK